MLHILYDIPLSSSTNPPSLPLGTPPNHPLPHHQCTTHFEEHVDEIQSAYVDALSGCPSSKPVIEMCVPSVLDRTIAPEGDHVVNLFVQYAPYRLANGRSWDDEKEAYADKGTKGEREWELVT